VVCQSTRPVWFTIETLVNAGNATNKQGSRSWWWLRYVTVIYWPDRRLIAHFYDISNVVKVWFLNWRRTGFLNTFCAILCRVLALICHHLFVSSHKNKLDIDTMRICVDLITLKQTARAVRITSCWTGAVIQRRFQRKRNDACLLAHLGHDGANVPTLK